jgi:hypothetical protein
VTGETPAAEDADGRLEFRVAMRLLPAEYSRLVIESILNDCSVGELLRAAYFPGDEEDGARQRVDD